MFDFVPHHISITFEFAVWARMISLTFVITCVLWMLRYHKVYSKWAIAGATGLASIALLSFYIMITKPDPGIHISIVPLYASFIHVLLTVAFLKLGFRYCNGCQIKNK